MFIYIGYDHNKSVHMYVHDSIHWNLNNWGVKENVQVINPFLKFSIQSKMFLHVQMGIELAQSHANIHGLSFFQGNSSVLKTRLCRMQSESTLLMCTKLEMTSSLFLPFFKFSLQITCSPRLRVEIPKTDKQCWIVWKRSTSRP